MPSTGSGTGTAVSCGITPTTIPDALPRSCVSLARWAQLVRYDECAMWGVSYDQLDTTCFKIMREWERDEIAYYLAEALQEIENELNYPLCPTWFTDEVHPWQYPVLSSWGRVIAGGVRATTSIAASSAIDYTNDPAVVGPIATTVTDTDEIKVFYPGSEREIEPSAVSISGGNVTIYIPRCRLVDPDYFDNPAEGWPWADLTYFVNVVDVTRVYNDPSTHAELVWPHGTGSCPSCSEATQDGCIAVRNGRIGELGILPASYNGSWTQSSWSCFSCRPSKLRLNYYAGELTTSLIGENSVVRLAHSKMPQEPCGCDITRTVWGRDRKITEPLTPAQALNPFGRSDGAYAAWRFVRGIKLVRGALL